MVVNLCLHPFHTTIHSSKLCADGYDVTNLVSADPAVRRRGFKLEYFLRPPLQVTLTFDFKVEICRVDAELWPWGMDRGQACKKLEIGTCSDSNSDFKVVGRCELREETKVCFSHSHFRPRPPFQHPPPPLPANCRHEALWSRGFQSLGAVTQLRVALPFGGAASAIGLKSLSVWGQPARCCPAEKVETIQKAHEASVRPTPAPVSASPVPPKLKRKAPTSQSFSVPEEFLDPITQEVMVLPMLLPGGVSVDHSTLEEYQKREATWGRAPKDPFTGVPFSTSSQPLPNPQLKSRIDHFLLQSGQSGKEGRLGRQAEGKDPQPSRLVASEVDTGANNTSQTKISTLNCEQARKRDFTVYANNTPEDGQESQLPQEKKLRINQVLAKKSCSGCSCSISVYATPSSPIYRLKCGHFLCRSCLQKPSKPFNTRSPQPLVMSLALPAKAPPCGVTLYGCINDIH
uniref:U-box domain containing 5 n=1 Tax=Neogobius melanostomus TaxID=47308 RepID=A0A8C6UMK2_9GOBI